jgi:hypothetical protein
MILRDPGPSGVATVVARPRTHNHAPEQYEKRTPSKPGKCVADTN